MKQILIIKLGSLGDVLRTTCILPGLHEKFPNARIAWLTSHEAVPLLVGNPLVHQVLSQNEFLGPKTLKPDYDLVISLDDDIRACEFAATFLPHRLIGAYFMNGASHYTDDFSKWFDMSLISRYGKKKADQLKKENRQTYPNILFEALNISRGTPSLLVPDSDRAFAHHFSSQNFPKDRPVIGLNTGAGTRWRFKQLSVEATAELIDTLKETLDATIVLLGGIDERGRNKTIQQLAKYRTINGGHDNSLLHFAALIERCDLLITSDSLALHIASCLNIPVIAFFGPTSKHEIELFSTGKKLTPKMDCLCCYKHDCNVRPTCMDNISIIEILKATKNLLQIHN